MAVDISEVRQAVNDLLKSQTPPASGGLAQEVRVDLDTRKNGVDVVRITVYNPKTPRAGGSPN